MARRRSGAVAILVTLVACAAPAFADDVPVEAAREVFKKNQNTVVWVSAVIKTRGGGALAAMLGQQEQKVEAVGTVIHESGLTVVSHTNIDPTTMMNSLYSQINVPGQEGKIEFKSELSGVKIRLADGTEVPAKLVMTDEDLDLAFILPTDKSKKLPYLNLDTGGTGNAGAKEMAVLDPLIVLGRLDQALDRQPAVYPTRVNAVVKKPRTFYVCGDLQSLGTPAFSAEGKPVGIVVMRRQNVGGARSGMMNFTSSGGMAVVIIPAADVMEVAQQALTKKADAKEASSKQEKAGEEKSDEAPKAVQEAPAGKRSKSK